MSTLDIEDILNLSEDNREKYEKDLNKIQESDSLQNMKSLLLTLPNYVPESTFLRNRIFQMLAKLVENHFAPEALKVTELMCLFPLMTRMFNLDRKIYLREVPESLDVRCFPLITTERTILHSLDNYVVLAKEPYSPHCSDKENLIETLYANYLILLKSDVNSCLNFIRKFPDHIMDPLLNTDKEFSKSLLAIIIEKSKDCQSSAFFRTIQILINRGYRKELLALLDSRQYISGTRELLIRQYLG